MSITDELRNYAQDWRETPNLMDDLDAGDIDGLLDDFIDIADRIDAEHEAKVSYWQGASYKDGYDDGFASADDWLAQHEDAMAEHGWIRLPKDADDVPWSVGDRDEDGNTVTQLRLSSDGWYAVTDGPSAFHPEQRRHYHAHTVEDVLREFADGWDFAEGIGKGDSYMKTFAAKLRLAEEDA